VTTLWLIGVAIVLGRFAFGTARIWWISRQAYHDVAWAPLAHQLAAAIGVERRITFLGGREDAMPMAWGLWRPHVLLPGEADDWPATRQRVVLLHELAHIKRRDSLTQLMAHLACAAYWFNPLVWIAAHRLRAERERACDDLVLAAGTRGSDYADHLLDIARSLRSGAWPTWSAVTMAHRSQLEGRLMAILDPALSRRSPTRRSLAIIAGLALITVVSLAGARPVAKGIARPVV
jgi:beta-lactamase regulating signal transducer with metallopeptidase domain